MWTVTGRDPFVIHAERIAHLLEQSRDGIGADTNAECEEFLGDSGCRSAGPTQASHRIARGIVLQQAVKDVDYIGRFFSVAGRPPPWRRVRPLSTSRSSSCCRPRATV